MVNVLIFLCPQNWQAAATSASQFFSILLIGGGGLGTAIVIVRWLAATAFVALLAYFSIRMMAVSRGRGRKGGNLKIIESISLGGNSFVHLIKAADKYLVVGVTRENVTLLSELTEEEVIEEELVLFDPKDTPFGKVLARFMPLKPDIQNRNGNQDE